MPFPAIGDYGPYGDWSETTAYSEGDVVYYGGYLYRAMTSITAGDDPRTATFTCTFTNTAGISGGTSTRTMRKWRIFDLPNSYYQAMLRGIPPGRFGTSTNTSPLVDYVRTISAAGFKISGEVADECSWDGYGFFAGLDVTYSIDTLTTVDKERLLYSFSAVPMDRVDQMLGGSTYDDPTNNYTAVFWQPNTVGDGTEYPAWGDDCQGMMFASMQTFGRDYTVLESYSLGPPETTSTADLTTVSFQDNWTSVPVSSPPIVGIPLVTDPDFATDAPPV